MKRNIVQQGPTTLMISLPIKWVKKYDLKKGEQLDIKENERNLIISTEKVQENNKVKVNLINEDYVYIWRILSSVYYSGYNEIEIIYISNKTLDWIQHYVEKYFIGFDIIKQENNFCIIKNISSENKNEFDTILRRVFLNLIQTSKIYLDFLENKQDPSLILNLERTNNRQTSFLKRIITKEGYKNNKKTNFMYVLIFLLEQIINEYKYSVWDIKEKENKKEKINITKKVLRNYKRLHEEIEDVYKLYYKFNLKLAKKIIVDDLKTKTKTNENIELLEENQRLAYTILNITEKIRYIAFQIIAINSDKLE